MEHPTNHRFTNGVLTSKKELEAKNGKKEKSHKIFIYLNRWNIFNSRLDMVRRPLFQHYDVID